MKQIKLLILSFVLPLFVFSQQTVSLETKIGQMLMMGLTENKGDAKNKLFKDVKAGRVGGILIYEKHLTEKNTSKNLQALIKAYQAVSPTPLFVSIDQEGGLVNRLKTKYGFPHMPSAQYLGTLDNLDSTKLYADTMSFTMANLGINLNYAPVLDVYMATNPVLGSRQRTYAADPAIITKHAGQTIISHHNYGVGTVVKHFPGHGSSTADSHLGLTDVSKTWKPEELIPYKNLIDSGLVEAVMTAHIVNTQLEPNKLPATLSKTIMTGLLRDQLGFKGVIFSDDMQMKAISDEYGLKDAIEKAINAGVDVLMFSGNITGVGSSSAESITKIILKLIKEGKVSEQSIHDSYERIMKMKSDRGMLGK